MRLFMTTDRVGFFKNKLNRPYLGVVALQIFDGLHWHYTLVPTVSSQFVILHSRDVPSGRSTTGVSDQVTGHVLCVSYF